MVPGETTVETTLSQKQSALRKAAAEYCEAALKAGWVQDNGGLAGLADTLINGQTAEHPGAPKSYADLIGSTSAAPSIVLARIASDAAEARRGLQQVNREADAVLASDPRDQASIRGDVMGYERALVRAQMAYRGFQTALSQVAARDDMDMDTAPVDAELGQFATTIDAARSTADELADKYASIRRAAS